MHPGDQPQIRPMTRADVPPLASALGAAQGAYYESRLALQAADKGVVLVAVLDGGPVGAVFLSWDPPEEPEVRAELPDVALLYRIEIRADMRRRGIGTILIHAAHALLRAHGHQRVALGVDLTNKDAIRLYERLGYEEWDKRPIGSGAAAYTMMVFDLARQLADASTGPAGS